MAEVFNFDTGLKEYVINGYSVFFNPVDVEFINRFNSAMKRLGAKQDALKDEMKSAGDDSERVIAALEDYCASGTELFDGLLGDGATAGVFCGCSPFAIQAETRLPLWVILADKLTDLISDALLELPDEVKTDTLLASGAKSKAILTKYKVKM